MLLLIQHFCAVYSFFCISDPKCTINMLDRVKLLLKAQLYTNYSAKSSKLRHKNVGSKMSDNTLHSLKTFSGYDVVDVDRNDVDVAEDDVCYHADEEDNVDVTKENFIERQVSDIFILTNISFNSELKISEFLDRVSVWLSGIPTSRTRSRDQIFRPSKSSDESVYDIIDAREVSAAKKKKRKCDRHKSQKRPKIHASMSAYTRRYGKACPAIQNHFPIFSASHPSVINSNRSDGNSKTFVACSEAVQETQYDLGKAPKARKSKRDFKKSGTVKESLDAFRRKTAPVTDFISKHGSLQPCHYKLKSGNKVHDLDKLQSRGRTSFFNTSNRLKKINHYPNRSKRSSPMSDQSKQYNSITNQSYPSIRTFDMSEQYNNSLIQFYTVRSSTLAQNVRLQLTDLCLLNSKDSYEKSESLERQV